MTDGFCTVCPNKCEWMKHSNLPFIYEYYEEMVTKRSQDLYNNYIDAQSKLSQGE